MSYWLLLAFFGQYSLAEEGMWRPEQLPDLADGMKASGLDLDVAQLAKLDGAVLGSIVDLSQCSGAFVSEEGLLVTSYHCIGGSLQFASQSGEDLFENGYHAKTRSEERFGGPSEHVRVTIAVNEVTDDVLSGTKRLEGAAFFDRVQENTQRLVERCEGTGDVRCRVAIYGDGAEYQLITQKEFKDVRLVYAPPRSVGYFGGSADNWRWPRHSGDFAFLRVYADEQGRSTKYNRTHKPYKPAHYLPVSRRSVQENDFVMVAGYPRNTYRWNGAAELDYKQNEQFPRQVSSIRTMMSILEERSAADSAVGAKIAPRMLNLENNLQYIEGTLHGFKRTGLSQRKWLFEKDLTAWINADRERKARYGNVLGRMNVLQAEVAGLEARNRVMTDLSRQSAPLRTALLLYQLAVESEKPDRRRKAGFQNRNRPQIEGRLDAFNLGYDWVSDREILAYNLERALKLPSGTRPLELDEWFKTRNKKSSMEAMLKSELDLLYANEELADGDQRRSLMDSSAWYMTHHGNPWFELAAALYPYYAQVEKEQKKRIAQIRALKPLYMRAVGAFVEATHQADGGASFYADANGTLRLTFGQVRGYTPRDGMRAAAHTSLRGIEEKHGDKPFDAPEALLRAIRANRYGSYAIEGSETLPVNFVTTLDTARGSSGSATMNAQGEWVGLIFDGNYESMVSDWVYDEKVTRSIHTDAAYVLWYLDAVAGAESLLRELGKEPELLQKAAQTQ